MTHPHLDTFVYNGFSSKKVDDIYPIGTKSNVERIKKALLEKEIITLTKEGVFLADHVFETWFKREFM